VSIARRSVTGSSVLLFLVAPCALAQGYRVRLDTRIQSVSWRGLTPGTIPRSEAVQQPNGGFLTPDGHAAVCGETQCTFFAAGPVLRGVPWVTQADLSVWGIGLPGLSLRANARWATDLGDGAVWPGTEPELQLIEGYLEYARTGLTARAGRQFPPVASARTASMGHVRRFVTRSVALRWWDTSGGDWPAAPFYR